MLQCQYILKRGKNGGEQCTRFTKNKVCHKHSDARLADFRKRAKERYLKNGSSERAYSKYKFPTPVQTLASIPEPIQLKKEDPVAVATKKKTVSFSVELHEDEDQQEPQESPVKEETIERVKATKTKKKSSPNKNIEESNTIGSGDPAPPVPKHLPKKKKKVVEEIKEKKLLHSTKRVVSKSRKVKEPESSEDESDDSSESSDVPVRRKPIASRNKKSEPDIQIVNHYGGAPPKAPTRVVPKTIVPSAMDNLRKLNRY